MTSVRQSIGSTALVTGASSGIGREFATIAAADGYDVVLVARRESRLVELSEDLEAEHGVAATVLPVDLAEPGAAGTVAAAVEEHDVDVDLLVNNAGVATWGRFDEVPPGTDHEMLRVNVEALTGLTKLFSRPMVDRGRGAILNVASIAGEAPHSGMPVYAATKAYVISLSRGLSRQLGPLGVTVTVLSPGWTDTAMGRELAAAGGRDVSEWMDPETAARAGYDGLLAGEPVVIPGASNRQYVRDAHAKRASEIEFE
jgi:hypothetical protein